MVQISVVIMKLSPSLVSMSDNVTHGSCLVLLHASSVGPLSLLPLITTLITSYANVAVFGFCYRVLTSQKKLASYVTKMYAPTTRCFTFDCIVLVGRRLYSKVICPITLLSPRYRVRVWYCPTRKRYSLYIVLRILLDAL